MEASNSETPETVKNVLVRVAWESVTKWKILDQQHKTSVVSSAEALEAATNGPHLQYEHLV